ncbi:MAG: sugar phosphate isomerase/epimerase family protein [Candidatus Eremiobacterota bacterium]
MILTWQQQYLIWVVEMYNFGLKLWSTNKNYIDEAVKLYKDGVYKYIELYAVPDSYNAFIDMWVNLGIPYIIHAPHYRGGLNLASKENKDKNLKLVEEVIKFADKLDATYIIFHPGVAGSLEETVNQLNDISDERIIIENKPYYGLDDGLVCNGNSPEEIRFIMDNTHVGFCFDIGHAICSANVYTVSPLAYLMEFIKQVPQIYHLTDGDYNGLYDRHDHFGYGNFPIEEILNILLPDSYITVETIKDSIDNLSDFVSDINYLHESVLKNEKK